MPNFRSIELSDPRIPVDGLRFATLKSPALRQRADVTWYATPGAETATDLPIVVLLHGVYGSHWAWAMQGDAHRTAARLRRRISNAGSSMKCRRSRSKRSPVARRVRRCASPA